MTQAARKYTVPTSHGPLSIEESGTGARTVFMIHGNSSCGEVFRHQFQGPSAATHRLIAVDLPGHGASADAADPARSYTLPGFADALIELLDRLALPDPILLGWSLGGHIALEMASRMTTLRGIMICGTPPVGRVMSEGFRPDSGVKYGSQENLSQQDIDAFGRNIFGASFNPLLREAMARADGRARRIMFEGARAGLGADQRWVVGHIPTPLAIVNGADDSLINLDFIDGLQYAKLWSGRCHRLPGAGHAPFRESPAAFNALLAQFLADLG